MNTEQRKRAMRGWRKAVRHHKRICFTNAIRQVCSSIAPSWVWVELQELPLIPMKPKKGEEQSEQWTGYYTPEEYVDRVLPAFERAAKRKA